MGEITSCGASSDMGFELNVSHDGGSASSSSSPGVLGSFGDLLGDAIPLAATILRQHGFATPLKLQKGVIPAMLSAMQSSNRKAFIIVQGPPQSGRTSSLCFSLPGSNRH